MGYRVHIEYWIEKPDLEAAIEEAIAARVKGMRSEVIASAAYIHPPPMQDLTQFRPQLSSEGWKDVDEMARAALSKEAS